MAMEIASFGHSEKKFSMWFKKKFCQQIVMEVNLKTTWVVKSRFNIFKVLF